MRERRQFKTAIKIFLIIADVIYIIMFIGCVITSSIFSNDVLFETEFTAALTMSIVWGIFAIISVITTVFQFNNLDSDQDISLCAKICILLFVSQCAGILLLCMPKIADDEYSDKSKSPLFPYGTTTSTQNSILNSTNEDIIKLRELKMLMDEGILTEAEFTEMKAGIIKKQ